MGTSFGEPARVGFIPVDNRPITCLWSFETLQSVNFKQDLDLRRVISGLWGRRLTLSYECLIERIRPLSLSHANMRPLIQEVGTTARPESLCEQLQDARGVVLLRTALFDDPRARYSFVTAEPFLTFRSLGSRCELVSENGRQVQFGNPWRLLDVLMSRYELLDEIDLPFPLGGCFGYWGYDLKNFVEPRLTRLAVNDLELPDCQVGFYDSVVVFDHRLAKAWIVSTGLTEEGSRSATLAQSKLIWWQEKLRAAASQSCDAGATTDVFTEDLRITSNLSGDEFVRLVRRAQEYIRAGDIYQVNLSHRLKATIGTIGPSFASPRSSPPAHPLALSPKGERESQALAWSCYRRLSDVSPAPFSAFLDCGDFQVISSSPELFLRLSGSHIQTRPIKGTRPRSSDPIGDAQLSYELQTSSKEMAELIMITDLLRNDLGKICNYGSVQVPELVRLERYPQVQHLVSTVEGELRTDVSHFAAFASCFPGGSITGAPKIRAMEIIDELEPITRGPYTGSIGYLGFNRESQLNIAIRTAIALNDQLYFHSGAGIVADSEPEAEYKETMAKAGGFIAALSAQRDPAVKAPV